MEGKGAAFREETQEHIRGGGSFVHQEKRSEEIRGKEGLLPIGKCYKKVWIVTNFIRRKGTSRPENGHERRWRS